MRSYSEALSRSMEVYRQAMKSMKRYEQLTPKEYGQKLDAKRKGRKRNCRK